MFKINDNVIYPVYGAGKITDIHKEEINGKEVDYYDIELFSSKISISAAVDSAEEQGMRVPSTKKDLEDALKKLGKKVKISEQLLEEIDDYCRERLKSGSLDDAIVLYNTLIFLEKHKAKENKNFSYTHQQRLETITNYIRSEIELVMGEAGVKKYKLEVIIYDD